MWADKYTLAAFDAKVFFPNRDLKRNVSFFPLGRAYWIRSIQRQSTDGQLVASTGNDFACHLAYECRRLFADRLGLLNATRDCFRNSDFIKVLQRCINGCEVLTNHGFASLAVRLADRLFDSVNRLLSWQNPTNCKEARLHDRIDAITKLSLFRNLIAIDRINSDVLVDDGLLDGSRKVIPEFVAFEWAVDQQRGTLFGRI